MLTPSLERSWILTYPASFIFLRLHWHLLCLSISFLILSRQYLVYTLQADIENLADFSEACGGVLLIVFEQERIPF